MRRINWQTVASNVAEAREELERLKAIAGDPKRRSEVKPFWLEPPYELVSVIRPTNDGQPSKTARVQSDDMLKLLQAPRRYD